MQGKIAGESFSNGFNCAQSIISTFGPALGISRDLALKMATGLGAGGNYNGKICGAIMGAFIILSLKYGSDKPNDTDRKQLVKLKLDDFTSRFKEQYGTIECNELLNTNVSIPEELQRLRDNRVFQEVCTKIVSNIADLIEDILTKEDN
jgi:C_GCAxxG_C_C family probable redox protein